VIRCHAVPAFLLRLLMTGQSNIVRRNGGVHFYEGQIFALASVTQVCSGTNVGTP
jgi:hypothetical protein